MTPTSFFVKKQLVELRNRVEKRRSADQPVLTAGRIWLARLGFLRRPNFSGFWIFASGLGLLLIGFTVLGQISSSVSSAKKILGETTVGIGFLQNGDLAGAGEVFAGLETELGDLPIPGFADRLRKITAHLSLALKMLEETRNAAEHLDLGWDVAVNSSAPGFYNQLQDLYGWFGRADVEITAAGDLAEGLPLWLFPEQFHQKITEQKNLFSSVGQGLRQARIATELVLALLEGEPRVYLLIFQNNNEARATGGFIGTYGLIKVGDGRITISKIESIYEPDGQLNEKIAAPGPLQRQAAQLWAMRDANWFADFPSSSRKILEFLEKETSVLAEGVISFTPDVFEELLALTGPVDMSEYGLSLSAQNFRETVQFKTSIDYDRQQNQPKKFLADFAPRLLAKIGGIPQERLPVLAAFVRAAAKKHFLMFSLEDDLQGKILELGAGGQIKAAPDDYLAIVHSNVGGGKTDQGIRQTVKKTVDIDEFGRRQTTLNIERVNLATNEPYFPVNVDWMRVFVPYGAKLLEQSGFDTGGLAPSTFPSAVADADLASWDREIQFDRNTGVYVGREAGHSVFMGWQILAPGESKTVMLRYALPVESESYSLVLQKQSGAAPFDFALSVEDQSDARYRYPDAWQTVVDSDRVFGVARP